MWGGFDLSSATKQLGAIGSQLGEALQKAKQEVESTIEGFEKGDDYVPIAAAAAGQPPADTSSTTPASGFAISSADSSTRCSTEDGASSCTADAVPAAPAAAAAAPSAQPAKPKRKVIKKIIKKVPAHEATPTAAAPSSTSTPEAGQLDVAAFAASAAQRQTEMTPQQVPELLHDSQPGYHQQAQCKHEMQQQQQQQHEGQQLGNQFDGLPSIQQGDLQEGFPENGWGAGLDASDLQLTAESSGQLEAQQDAASATLTQQEPSVPDIGQEDLPAEAAAFAPFSSETQAEPTLLKSIPSANGHSLSNNAAQLAEQHLQQQHSLGQHSQQQDAAQMEQLKQQKHLVQDAWHHQPEPLQEELGVQLPQSSSAGQRTPQSPRSPQLLQHSQGLLDSREVAAASAAGAETEDGAEAESINSAAAAAAASADTTVTELSQGAKQLQQPGQLLEQQEQQREQQQEQQQEVALRQVRQPRSSSIPAHGDDQQQSLGPSPRAQMPPPLQQQQQQQQQQWAVAEQDSDSTEPAGGVAATQPDVQQQDRSPQPQQHELLQQEADGHLGHSRQREQGDHHHRDHQQQHMQPLVQHDMPAGDWRPDEQHIFDSAAVADSELCAGLQQQLAAREGQLSRAAGRLSELELTVAQLTEAKADLEVVVQQLTDANEQLALRAAKVSEAELQEIQQEAAERLAAAERKVYALTKERDALKRAAAASSAGAGSGAELAQLKGQLHKKDELVTQLMDEGQKLSKRQLELEGNVKKLRQQLKASEAERDKLSALLAAEASEAEGLRRAKAKAERDLVAAVEAGRQEVEAVRSQAQADLLNSQAEQAAAQAVAAQAAAGELAASLKAAEARNAALTESLAELQEALERQRAAADLREEMLRQDMGDVERRAQAAELRHQELSAKLPEATAPLLRQISALQDASSTQAQAWAAAERSLTSRLWEAEAAAAAAAARDAVVQEEIGALQIRLAAAEASAAAAKASATEASNRAARAEERLAVTQAQLDEQQAASAEAQALISQLREDLRAVEAAAARKLDSERSVRRAAQEELSRTRSELEALRGSTGASSAWGAAAGLPGGPPAMAAPGFKWVLVSEAEEAAAAAVGGIGGLARRMSSISSQAAYGMQRLSGALDDDLAGLPGTPASLAAAAAGGGGAAGSGSQQGSEAAGLFDPGELLAAGQGGLMTPSYGPRASADMSSQGYAGALGSPTGSMTSSKAAGAGASQAAQARMVAARLGGGGTVAEAAVQRLRAALRQKAGECASLEARLRELEATRDQLAGELVKATHSAEQAANAVARLPQLQAEYSQLEARYAAAVELLGERDEQLEELGADLADVKQLYKQQIEALLAQLAQTGSATSS